MTDFKKEYHLAELRRGSIYDSGKLQEALTAWSMGMKGEHTGPAYHSAFWFSDDLERYVIDSIDRNDKGKPSLRGYKGKHWAPYFVLDVDNHDKEHPELAKDQTDDVLRVLVEYCRVDPTKVLFCFSGNKGFHLYVPTAYFAPDPCEDFGRRIRHMVEKGIWPHLNETIFPNVKDVDWSIYDTLRCFRAINSQHEKGEQLWKIPISLADFHAKTFAEIRDLAGGPCTGFPFPAWKDVRPNEEMKALWAASATWREDAKKDFGERKTYDFASIADGAKNVPDRRLCAMKLSQVDVGHGSRNSAALMLISEYMELGFTPEQTLEQMRGWLKLQKGTTKGDDYLATQIRYVYDGGHAAWGCFHPLASANCFKQCKLFPQANAERSAASEWKQMDTLWAALVERAKQPIYYEVPFGTLSTCMRLRPKQANVLIGPTGSGKTALSLEILRHNSSVVTSMKAQDPTFRAGLGMFSLEMPGEELAERDGQFFTNQDQGFVDDMVKRQLKAMQGGTEDPTYLDMARRSIEGMSNVWFYDGSAVDLKRITELMKVGKEQYGINFFIIDFLDRVRSRGANKIDRLEPIVIGMKDVVRELDVMSLTLVQVARTTAEKGPLGMRSGRGSGQIEENADNVLVYDALTTEQLQLLALPEIEGCRYMSMLSPKVRGGDPRGAAVVEFYGKTMTFRDVGITDAQREVLRR